MVRVDEGGLHELRQILVLTVWFGFSSLIGGILSHMFHDSATYFPYFWTFLVIYVMVRTLAEDFEFIYNFNYKFQEILVQLTRLGIIFAGAFILVYGTKSLCNVTDDGFWSQIGNLSIFEYESCLTCNCTDIFCKIGIRMLSLIIAICRVRMQIVILQTIFSLYLFMAEHLFRSSGQGPPGPP